MKSKKGNFQNTSLLDRRNFLKLAGIAGTGAFVISPTDLFAQLTKIRGRPTGLSRFTERLPIPEVLDATAGGTFNLNMAPAMHQFHKSIPMTPTWGYGGATYLGPTIEARRNVPITIKAQNQLGVHPLAYAVDPRIHGALESDKVTPRVSLHLHGGNTEPESDGHPEDTFLPGETYTYNYNNNQEAANLWYHDHALGITRLNVYAGLAGLYLLRDDLDTGQPDNPLRLPAGRYEVPLVIQDKIFNPDGTLGYPLGNYDYIWSPEMFGDIAVVNGKAFPNLFVDRGLYRFRITNGSNARFYQLYLSERVPMYQIGSDGGLFNEPVRLSQIVLSPGERADVLINFSTALPGMRIVLKNLAPVPFPNGAHSVHMGGLPVPEIMQFTVTKSRGMPGIIPQTLRELPIEPLTDPVVVRNLTLVELMDEDFDTPFMALLNNLPWHTPYVEKPKVDTVEQWNIINTTGDTHPIHLHLVDFQVKSRQKFKADEYLRWYYPNLMDSDHSQHGPYPPPPADAFTVGMPKQPERNEVGWRDTVQAHPEEITTIMVPFGANAAPNLPFGNSFTGEYVWHCHILEHEDNEMMLPFIVVP